VGSQLVGEGDTKEVTSMDHRGGAVPETASTTETERWRSTDFIMPAALLGGASSATGSGHSAFVDWRFRSVSCTRKGTIRPIAPARMDPQRYGRSRQIRTRWGADK